ncbi:LysM peptidoglycan-binding domain-containing protein [Streptococcus mitis]|uniref:LysM peptidoglycan-binding domain-containing protein n=1 Tax=Streptococcus mitis TaxID=28037 RepID=UPI00066B917F|nr:LysM peptidoglycan-binding domain-containing protein [Streptococcus mitis]
MKQTNVRGTLSLRGFRKLRTGAIVATGVILLGLGFLAPTVSASEQDGVWVARTVAEVKADIQKEGDLFKYVIKWGDTLSVISEASNIPVDVLQEMNQTSGKNLFLPHNELYFTEAETISDTVTKHKIVIKESGASGEVRTYEVLLKKDQETKAVTFELTDVTEKVEKMAVNYSPVYQPVSAPVVERAEESGEELASEAPAETSPEVKEETEAPVASKAETRSETLNAPSAYTTNGSGNSTESSPAADKAPSNIGTTNQPVASNPSSEAPAPKAEVPVTPAPKVEAPSTPMPKAEEPSTPAPKAEAPASPMPKAEGPSTSAPKAELPSTPAPKVDEPTATAPKLEEPATPAPKVDEPATPAPKVDEPATPAPKVEESVAPAPKAEEPAVPAPKVDEPVSPAPKVDEPTATAPKAEEPATPAPKSEEPTTPAPKAEEPTTPAPKVEEPATPAPKVEESVSPAPKSEAPVSPAPKSEEPVAPAPKSEEPTTPAPKAEEPATPAPVTPSEEAPVTSGDTNSTAQPAGESGKSETKSEPSNTPSAEATNDSGNVATSSPVTDGTTSNTGTTEQPETPASKPEATIPKEDKLPTNQNGDTSNPVDSKDETPNPAPAPKEDTSSEEVAPKDEKFEEAKKEGKDIIEGIASSKLSEIEKVKDEAEKEKLKAELKTLKEDALAAIKNAKNHDAAVAATDEYQTKIDEINVPGEELPAPNYNKDNLTNGRNEGTTINDGSTAIGHGSGEATATTPAQPSSTSERTSSFRNAPSVQARARRVARSTSEPDGTVNISYNFAGMPDIHGFLSDPGEDNTVTIPAGTSEAQAKVLVKEKIQAKIKDLAARGYHVKNDIIFEQDTTVKNYNYVVTFTKEATGTSGFRMAPAVQPRASRNRRSLEQPAPQKVKVNVFYNFDQMKDIAGFLGDINGTSLEIAEGLSNEEVKVAVKKQVEAKKEELSKRGYTFKEDYVYQSNGKDYNYVVTFSKAAK